MPSVGSLVPWMLLTLAALLLIRHLVARCRRARPAPAPPSRGGRRAERFELPLPEAESRTAPRPGQAGNAMAAALRRAVDDAVPPPAPGEVVPHDDGEIKELMDAVLRKVNAGPEDLRLSLVSYEDVRKTVDRSRTIRYELTANVYSRQRTMSSVIAASVDVAADGVMYVRSLRPLVQPDAGGPAPSNADGFQGSFVAFQPAVAPF